jgi:uncharacterized protein YdhG (YjbR/CyaY superfamily)
VPKEMQTFRISKATYKFPLDEPFPIALLKKTVKALVREREIRGSQTSKHQKRKK